MDSRLVSVETRLESLETKVEERGRETRPMWEQALKEIMDLRLEGRQGFEEVRQGLEEARKERKSLSRKVDILHDDVFNVRESHAELQERISAIESNTPTERLK
jgi:chromosome segregation ATPase